MAAFPDDDTVASRPAVTLHPVHFSRPSHSRSEEEKSAIEDLVAANLNHYRLNTDYKHGMHFMALSTAFVTGFDKSAQLRIGSTGFVGNGHLVRRRATWNSRATDSRLFEHALDRAERLLTVLDSRLLESQKRGAESTELVAFDRVDSRKRDAGTFEIQTQHASWGGVDEPKENPSAGCG